MKIYNIIVEDFNLDFIEGFYGVVEIKNKITLQEIDTNIYLFEHENNYRVCINFLGDELDFVWCGTTKDFLLKSKVWESKINRITLGISSGDDCLAFLKDFLEFAEYLSKLGKFHNRKKMELARKYDLKYGLK